MRADQITDPVFRAQMDYREGAGSQSDNPYPKGSPGHDDWAWEMHRLQVRELEALTEGVTA